MLRRLHPDERGATAVLVGLLLPALLAAGALGVGVTALGAGERELQRSADAAALAGAARMPLADPGEIVGGVGGLLPDATDATTTAEAFCADNLADASMTQAFAAGPATCTAQTQPDSPSLLNTLLGDSGLLDATSLLDQLGLGGGLLDPTAIVPALAHPRVQVTATATYEPPLGRLAGAEQVGASAQATARRRIKNAVLVPVLDLNTSCPTGLLGGLIGALTGILDSTSGILGNILSDFDDLDGDLAALIGEDCTVDANPVLDMTGDEVFAALNDLKAPLDALGLPGTALVDSLLLDLRDVYDPDGDAPTQREVLEQAAASDEDVFVFLTGTAGATDIPVLDVVPAPAGAVQSWLADDDADLAGVFDLVTTVGEARGLFRASLVE